jgi:acyl-coenzyme A synthetase/AMP-(fatty) acid ligase
VVDTWWQTETGGIMLTPLPGDKDAKPGAAMRPFYGVRVAYPYTPSITCVWFVGPTGFCASK